MILAIDVGNSHIVIGMIENGEIRNIVHLHTDVRETATEISIKLRQITDFYGLDLREFEGMNVRIDDPGSVAADLIVGSVAAAHHYVTPAIVIDMGTATTVVVVDKGGSYRGGAILPGVKLSFNALSDGTSLLPDISILPPKKVVGTNTVDCMRSGAVYGTAAMFDGMIERMEAELGYPCTVVATGGLAKDIIPCCRRKGIHVDGELLLKGLWVLYQKNR